MKAILDGIRTLNEPSENTHILKKFSGKKRWWQFCDHLTKYDFSHKL